MSITGYATMSRTVAEMVQATERHLYGSQRGQLNKMNDASGINTTDTTVVMEFDLGGIRAGTYIEIDDEVLFVWSVNTSTKTATVERAQLGTTAATHADDSLVRVAPRFYRQQIVDALRDEIASWPANIFTVLTGEFTITNLHRSVDLDGATGLRDLRLLAARHEATSETVDDRWIKETGLRLEANANTTDYPSGWALVWSAVRTGRSLRVAIGAPFDTDPFASSTDLGAIGLAPSMIDIPPIGACARLLFPKEIGRTDAGAQGRSRLAEEVPAGHTSRTAQELLGWRNQRLNEEAKRLLNTYGWTER